jgi:hypothetical protein
MEAADAPTFRAAPLDGAARLAIAAAAAAVAVLLWWLVGTALDAPGRTLLHPAMLVALGLVALLGPATVGDWLRTPVAYSVEPGRLTIHRRRAKAVTLAVTGPAERFPGATRLRARGVFYGCRWLPEGGNPGLRNAFKAGGPAVFVAATDLSRAVRLEVARGSAVVTPAEPDAFLDATRWTP